MIRCSKCKYSHSRWFSINFSEKQEFAVKATTIMEILLQFAILHKHVKWKRSVYRKNPGIRKLSFVSGRRSLQGCSVSFVSDIRVLKNLRRRNEKSHKMWDEEICTQCVFRSTDWKRHHLVSNEMTRFVITANIFDKSTSNTSRRVDNFHSRFWRDIRSTSPRKSGSKI